MGKRGPQPNPDKRQVVSIVIDPRLRARLVAAAKKSQSKSVSREIERRLVASFTKDDAIIAHYGSRRNRAVLKLVAMLMENSVVGDEDWATHPDLFDQFIRAFLMLMFTWRPPGDDKLGGAIRYADQIEAMFNTIRSAPAWGRSLASNLKRDLGELVERAFIKETEH